MSNSVSRPDPEITLARVHGDYYHALRIVQGREKKAERVRNRIKARNEVIEHAVCLWTTLRLSRKFNWQDIARIARRISYLAEGFHAEEQLPNARANLEEKKRVLDAVRKDLA